MTLPPPSLLSTPSSPGWGVPFSAIAHQHRRIEMATYSELAALNAWAYLQPHKFNTPNDYLTPEGYAQQQLEEGVRLGRKYSIIHIASNSVWSASKNRGAHHSYEGIGYHSCTRQLLAGFLQSPAKIIVHRESIDEGYSQTIIKPEGWWVTERMSSDWWYEVGRTGDKDYEIGSPYIEKIIEFIQQFSVS